MSATILYLPSTPLNILVSCVHALHYQTDAVKELWLIDQKNCTDNLYVQALQNWQSSPFSNVQVLCGNKRGLAKLQERKANFNWLSNQLQRLQPSTILTGSDRRVEFQFAIHDMQKNNGVAPEGGYLDDGLYSYSGRENTWYKDAISSFLKKVSYGFWWEEPKTVGASSLIKQTHLFQPHLALAELKQKKIVYSLSQKMFVNESLAILSQQVLASFDETATSYQNLELLIFVAHPSNVIKMMGYLPRLQAILSKFKHKNIAIKYHPRVGEGDPLQLANGGVKKIIPATLASEFVLPVLPQDCMVIGDVGTALLTCYWLRPDLKLTAILSKDNAFQVDFIPMMEKMGIEVVSSVEEIEDSA